MNSEKKTPPIYVCLYKYLLSIKLLRNAPAVMTKIYTRKGT